MAVKYGVMLGFENHGTPLWMLKKAMNYVTKINNPYLGVYPDIGNLKTHFLNIQYFSRYYRTGRGHIAAHLKETIPNHYEKSAWNRTYPIYRIPQILFVIWGNVELFCIPNKKIGKMM